MRRIRSRHVELTIDQSLTFATRRICGRWWREPTRYRSVTTSLIRSSCTPSHRWLQSIDRSLPPRSPPPNGCGFLGFFVRPSSSIKRPTWLFLRIIFLRYLLKKLAYQLDNLVMEGAAPFIEMIVEDGGYAWMSQDVSVSLHAYEQNLRNLHHFTCLMITVIPPWHVLRETASDPLKKILIIR